MGAVRSWQVFVAVLVSRDPVERLGRVAVELGRGGVAVPGGLPARRPHRRQHGVDQSPQHATHVPRHLR